MGIISKIKSVWNVHKKEIIVGTFVMAGVATTVTICYLMYKRQNRIHLLTSNGDSFVNLLSTGDYEQLAREREIQRKKWLANGGGEFSIEMKMLDARMDELNVNGIGYEVTGKLLQEEYGDALYCENDYYGERLSVYDAAEIWASNGCDEDYTFNYYDHQLNKAFNR